MGDVVKAPVKTGQNGGRDSKYSKFESTRPDLEKRVGSVGQIL
jgi:hypothetical protein